MCERINILEEILKNNSNSKPSDPQLKNNEEHHDNLNESLINDEGIPLKNNRKNKVIFNFYIFCFQNNN